MQSRKCDRELQQREFAEATYEKDAASRRPVTVMPCRLPFSAVAARGQCVSLLQAAKHVQAQPKAVDMCKLRREYSTTSSDSTLR